MNVQEKVDVHFSTDDPARWTEFQKNLRSKQFRDLVLKHVGTDEKLRRFVTNVGKHISSKQEGTKVVGQHGTYVVKYHKDANMYSCSCPNWTYKGSVNGDDCKHIKQVRGNMQKQASFGIPKHLVPIESHVAYESHRETSEALRRNKIENALRLQSEVTTNKAREDLELNKQLEEKTRTTVPLEPNKVVDQGIIEINGHIYVESGLMNKSLDMDKPLNKEMDDNISYIKAQTALTPKLDNESRFILDTIQPLEKIAKAEVKPYQQETQWTCSAACLKAVLNYYGHKVSERECGIYIRVRKNKGAETTDIVNAAKAMGFDAYEKSFTMDEAKKLTDKGVPIICDIQSFTKPGAGHYVVLADIEDNIAFLMDPNVKGNSRVLPLSEFESRWFDYEMKSPHKLMKHWGVIINPNS